MQVDKDKSKVQNVIYQDIFSNILFLLVNKQVSDTSYMLAGSNITFQSRFHSRVAKYQNVSSNNVRYGQVNIKQSF